MKHHVTPRRRWEYLSNATYFARNKTHFTVCAHESALLREAEVNRWLTALLGGADRKQTRNLSNATCLTQAFFRSDESCGKRRLPATKQKTRSRVRPHKTSGVRRVVSEKGEVLLRGSAHSTVFFAHTASETLESRFFTDTLLMVWQSTPKSGS